MGQVLTFRTIVGNDDGGFTPFSTRHIRVSVSNYDKGFSAKPFELDHNDLVLLVLEGKISIQIGDKKLSLEKLDQILLSQGETFSFTVFENATIEFVWAPGLF